MKDERAKTADNVEIFKNNSVKKYTALNKSTVKVKCSVLQADF